MILIVIIIVVVSPYWLIPMLRLFAKRPPPMTPWGQGPASKPNGVEPARKEERAELDDAVTYIR